MAQSNVLGFSPIGFLSGAAIAKNVVVKLDSTAGQVIVTTAITEVPLGVTRTSTSAAGQTIEIQQSGVAKVTASGVIALNAQVVASADGKVETFTSIGATGISCGVALTAAAAAGDVIEVQLHIPAVFGPANT